MKKIILVFIIGLFFYNIKGQNSETKSEPIETKQPEILTLGLGTGFNSFFGDFVKGDNISPLTNIRSSYSFSIEKRLGNTFGLQFLGSKGILSDNARSTSINDNRNFESQILQVGINVLFHLDNDILIKRKSPFSPYLSAGFNYLRFDSYTDYYDDQNRKYFYWDNGQIWNIQEGDTSSNAQQINRDYTYETLLEDSLTEYSRSTFSIPLTLGFKWKLSNNLQARLMGTYNLTFTDWIDNVSQNDNNDKYVYLGFSINYIFRKPDMEEKEKYKGIKLNEFSHFDEDKDGVEDVNDICHHTPEGIKVNEKGCPLDDDMDGVPNYIDVEKNTKPSVKVDELGRELTDSILEKRIFLRDSIEIERRKVFSDTTTTGKVFELFEKSNYNKNEESIKLSLSDLLKPVDIDNNGLISKNEINIAINSFFEGTNNFTVTRLYDIIDYYFDQY
jgi:hypothetical protein